MEAMCLTGSNLSCSIAMEPGKWEHRKEFIEKIVFDILAHCPVDEPLVIVSLGSSRLLMECILAQLLIGYGYKLKFLLVDPAYKLSNQDLNASLQSFRIGTEMKHLQAHKEPMPEGSIRFLSRCQNLTKYFPAQSNVVVIESLPPYGENIACLEKNNLEKKDPLHLLVGSRLVPMNSANSIAFFPQALAKAMDFTESTIIDCLPLKAFTIEATEHHFYIDYGCKIQSDGSYFLSFNGLEESYQVIGGIEPQVPQIKEAVDAMLVKEIETIKSSRSVKVLTHEEISGLIEKVKDVFVTFLPDSQWYTMSDYAVDRNETMAHIREHASHRYRKNFTLIADPVTGYRIDVGDI